MGARKTREWKMWHQMTWVENAGQTGRRGRQTDGHILHYKAYLAPPFGGESSYKFGGS